MFFSHVLDSNAAIGLFAGLIAADISLFHFAHLRHHELSVECFKMRDRIEELSKEIRLLRGESAHTTETNEYIRRIENHERALRIAYKLVLRRYYAATWGIKSVACGFLSTLGVGLTLLFDTIQYQDSCLLYCFFVVSVASLLIGTIFILFGDLWTAERAQTILDDWFQNR